MTADDPIEELVAEYLCRFESEGASVLEDLASKHPEQAAEIRARLDVLFEMGLTGSRPQDDGVDALPERLGEFRLLRRLGGGGMGVVYLAEQETIGRRVALKLIRPEHLYFPGHRERFRREFEAVARLQHEGIVPIHTVGEEGQIPYFAMEWVDGCSLAAVLNELSGRSAFEMTGRDIANAVAKLSGNDETAALDPLAPLYRGSWVKVSLRIVRRLALALDHAHQRGVLHRDVKPSNVLLTVDGRVLLVDFGLALSTGTQRMTRAGAQIGSLPYMSAEQVRGEGTELDVRTDVYSLGVTFYELLTLRTPYWSDDPEKMRRLILAGKPVAPSRVNRSVPRDVETVCLVAMELEPGRRYATAAEFAADLQNLLEHRPMRARRPGLALRARRWMQRHPSACVAVGVLMAAVPVMVWLQRGAVRANERLQSRIDVLELDDLRRQAPELRPAQPKTVAALDAWLARADALYSRLPIHRDALASLRKSALPYSKQDRERDRAKGREILADLQKTRKEIRQLAEYPTYRSEGPWREALTKKLKALRATVRHDRLTWRYDDLEAEVRDRLLNDLVLDLGRFGEVIARVRERRKFAADLEHASIDRYQSVWDRTRLAIANDPRYGGLELEPQLGLVPIGRDPDSRLFEFAHLETGEVPRRDSKTGKLEIRAEDGLVFVLLPGGKFAMGRHPVDPKMLVYLTADDRVALKGEHDEFPLVPDVVLDPFFVSKYEMTQAQWARITGRHPNTYASDKATGSSGKAAALHPVESVSHDECVEVMRWLDLQLPTEAQWEYAARGGTTAMWWTGDDKRLLRPDGGTPLVANLADAALRRGRGGLIPTSFGRFEAWDDGWIVHAPIGCFRPNPFGLYDVIGNVHEWCENNLSDYRGGHPVGPRGEFPRERNPRRAYRGGSFLRIAVYARVCDRNAAWPQFRWEDIGLRPVRPVRARR